MLVARLIEHLADVIDAPRTERLLAMPAGIGRWPASATGRVALLPELAGRRTVDAAAERGIRLQTRFADAVDFNLGGVNATDPAARIGIDPKAVPVGSGHNYFVSCDPTSSTRSPHSRRSTSR